VGSRPKIELAYIAGFLDGDGSLMLQLKKRGDGGTGFRFMTTICFYQDTRHEKTLCWIRECFQIGYLSRRKDGMSELRINGYSQVSNILLSLSPYIRFKRVQSKALQNACSILVKTKCSKLSSQQLKEFKLYKLYYMTFTTILLIFSKRSVMTLAAI